ncbi:MAG TPA: hypothetical protein VKB52_14565 [Rhodanobacteraceae bacterium]|nr:hypothetical protein [Rhodanobacteraceae bacterium]
MHLIAEDICQDISDVGRPSEQLIEWRQRYDGVLMVAYLDGKAVAGVSGPWPVNQYALTWWDRPMPARQLELFDSLAAAKQRVEEWAWRMRTIGVIDRPPANDPILPEATVSIVPEAQVTIAPARKAPIAPRPQRRTSWLDRLRDAFGTAPRRASSFDSPRNAPLEDVDLSDIHFAAYE